MNISDDEVLNLGFWDERFDKELFAYLKFY